MTSLRPILFAKSTDPKLSQLDYRWLASSEQLSAHDLGIIYSVFQEYITRFSYYAEPNLSPVCFFIFSELGVVTQFTRTGYEDYKGRKIDAIQGYAAKTKDVWSSIPELLGDLSRFADIWKTVDVNRSNINISMRTPEIVAPVKPSVSKSYTTEEYEQLIQAVKSTSKPFSFVFGSTPDMFRYYDFHYAAEVIKLTTVDVKAAVTFPASESSTSQKVYKKTLDMGEKVSDAAEKKPKTENWIDKFVNKARDLLLEEPGENNVEASIQRHRQNTPNSWEPSDLSSDSPLLKRELKSKQLIQSLHKLIRDDKILLSTYNSSSMYMTARQEQVNLIHEILGKLTTNVYQNNQDYKSLCNRVIPEIINRSTEITILHVSWDIVDLYTNKLTDAIHRGAKVRIAVPDPDHEFSELYKSLPYRWDKSFFNRLSSSYGNSKEVLRYYTAPSVCNMYLFDNSEAIISIHDFAYPFTSITHYRLSIERADFLPIFSLYWDNLLG